MRPDTQQICPYCCNILHDVQTQACINLVNDFILFSFFSFSPLLSFHSLFKWICVRPNAFVSSRPPARRERKHKQNKCIVLFFAFFILNLHKMFVISWLRRVWNLPFGMPINCDQLPACAKYAHISIVRRRKSKKAIKIIFNLAASFYSFSLCESTIVKNGVCFEIQTSSWRSKGQKVVVNDAIQSTHITCLFYIHFEWCNATKQRTGSFANHSFFASSSCIRFWLFVFAFIPFSLKVKSIHFHKFA